MTDLIHAKLAPNGVLTIQLNRPDKKNALNYSMFETIAEMLNGLGSDRRVRVVIIAGSDDCFSSGNDINDYLHNPMHSVLQQEPPATRFLTALANVNKPLIAAVNGPAVGIGATLLLHADIVIAGTSAIFQFPHVGLGLVPEAAATFLLPQIVGYQRASELVLMGEPFTAEQAREAGLVSRVVTDDLVLSYAQKRGAILAAKPAEAVLAAKTLMKRGREVIHEVMEEENKILTKRLESAEAKEALQAFLDKRVPDFSKLG